MNKGLFDFVAEFPLAAIVICGLLVLVATLIYRLSKKDMSILEGKFNILESKFSALSTEVKSAFGLIQKDISRIDERLNDHIRETDKKFDYLNSKIDKILEKIK